MTDYEKMIYELQAENHELRKMYFTAIEMASELQKMFDKTK